MTFPSTLSSFSRPQATDRLNSPSHSALHNTVSSALGQVEAVIGVDGANSVVGTLMSDVRNPASQGGGHVQGAAFGGTGQTTYTKGDILVASSASVLTKLAVGTVNGQILSVNNSAPAGIQWGAAGINKVFVNTASVQLARGQASVFNTLFASSVAGSTLGTSNTIRFTGIVKKLEWNSGSYPDFLVSYGSNTIASITTVFTTASVVSAKVEGLLTANGQSSQIGFLSVTYPAGGTFQGSPSSVLVYTNQSTSSIESSASQELNVQIRMNSTGTATSVLGGVFVVEKIT